MQQSEEKLLSDYLYPWFGMVLVQIGAKLFMIVIDFQ